MEQQFEQIAEYPTLTDSQRIQAQKNARRNIIDRYAHRPRREDFDDYTASRVPSWFTRLLAYGLVFVALAAGTISAFRLYYAGYNEFYASIPNHVQAVIVGILTPAAAEVLVIIAAAYMQVRTHQRGKARWAALIPVALGTVVAFVGNWQITGPNTTWGWVETIFPPAAVLSVAFFLELTLVPEMERRQQNENAYRAAKDEYDALVNAPELHEKWMDTYGWALWEMWSKVYSGHYDMLALDRDTRRALALREIGNDNFFQDEITGNFQKSQKATPEKTVSQGEVIAYIKANPGAETMKQSEIAELTGASPATVSRAFGKISRNGHESEDA